MPYVVTEECENCGACVAGCETDAITAGPTQAHVDVRRCHECGTCEMNCPVGAIVFVDDAEYERMRPTREASPPAPAEEPPR